MISTWVKLSSPRSSRCPVCPVTIQTTTAHYTYDLEKCEEEFKLADVDKDGVPAGEDPDDVWEMGFRVQMLYNTGNTTRQIYSRDLAANLAAVNRQVRCRDPWSARGLLTWLPSAPTRCRS